MRTHVWILSLVVLGAACNNADDEAITNMSEATTATLVDDKTGMAGEAAIVRRSARMDARAACIRNGDADTWKQLSLTTDQIRWIEQLQTRMNVRNERASETVKEPGVAYTYTFSTAERRMLAEILTDEQMVEWTAMCPDQPARAAM